MASPEMGIVVLLVLMPLVFLFGYGLGTRYDTPGEIFYHGTTPEDLAAEADAYPVEARPPLVVVGEPEAKPAIAPPEATEPERPLCPYVVAGDPIPPPVATQPAAPSSPSGPLGILGWKNLTSQLFVAAHGFLGDRKAHLILFVLPRDESVPVGFVDLASSLDMATTQTLLVEAQKQFKRCNADRLRAIDPCADRIGEYRHN